MNTKYCQCWKILWHMSADELARVLPHNGVSELLKHCPEINSIESIPAEERLKMRSYIENKVSISGNFTDIMNIIRADTFGQSEHVMMKFILLRAVEEVDLNNTSDLEEISKFLIKNEMPDVKLKKRLAEM